MQYVEIQCAVQPNDLNTIVVPEAWKYHIRVRVLGDEEEVISDASFWIEDDDGERIFEGKTDSDGYIKHDKVALGDYKLFIAGWEASVAAVAYEDEYVDLFLPPVGFIRVVVLDRDDKPLANAEYEILDDDRTLFNGTTDAQGRVKHDPVILDDYTLVIEERSAIIPALAYEDEYFSVFLDPHEARQEDQVQQSNESEQENRPD